jgi:hypothetical protein
MPSAEDYMQTIIRKVSTKPTVEHHVRGRDGIVEITFTVRTQAGTFVSSMATQREAPPEWVVEHLGLSSELRAYESILESVAAKCTLSGYTVPSTDVARVVWERNREGEIMPKVQFRGSGERPTPADWQSANLEEINDRLKEADHYRRNAGIISTPVGFYQSLKEDLDTRLMPLLGCIRQLRHQLEERNANLIRDLVTNDIISQAMCCPIALARQDRHSERDYALYRGVVWEYDRPLLPDQQRTLADSYLAREEDQLSQALGLRHTPESDNREAIPTSVRRAVWSRDSGRCAQCGSRDRLEYDHIIPVSKGGSNTERNIELLCEACNRAKSDSIR